MMTDTSISFANKSLSLPSRQRGLTMIEMIIASALSITLLTGVYQIYFGNKQTHTQQDELARLQENARFAMEFISKDIRKAGYIGCMRGKTTKQNNLATLNPVATFNPLIGLQGWEATGTEPKSTAVDIDPVGAVTSTTTFFGDATGKLVTEDPSGPLAGIPTALPQSDIIRVWFGSQQAQPVTTIVPSTTISLADDLNLKKGDMVVVSDCGRVDYVMVCNGSATDASDISSITINGCDNDLTNNFLTVSQETATARALETAIYFVGKSGAATAPTGLFKRRLNGRSASISELVSEGVENMQVLYGEDTLGNDNIADQYRIASSITDWSKVINVKISLLMSSANNVAAQSYQGSFELNGVTLKPAKDRRLRRVFTTTIALRNRV